MMITSKQNRLLADESHSRVPPVQVERFEIELFGSHENTARVRVVESLDKREYCRFAAATRSNKSQRFSSLDGKRDLLEHARLRSRRIRETHRVELQRTIERSLLVRFISWLQAHRQVDARLRVEDLEDSLRGSQCLCPINRTIKQTANKFYM